MKQLKTILPYILIILLLTALPIMADIDADLDDNDALDIGYGGTVFGFGTIRQGR